MTTTTADCTTFCLRLVTYVSKFFISIDVFQIFLKFVKFSAEMLESTNVNISDFDVGNKEMSYSQCSTRSRKTLVNQSFLSTKYIYKYKSQLLFIDNINNCLASIKKYDKILSDTELKLCADFITVLQVFEKATDVLQGDEYPTLNLTAVEIKDR